MTKTLVQETLVGMSMSPKLLTSFYRRSSISHVTLHAKYV